MSKAAMNLQDSFLNQVRRENTEVKVLLVNGTVLRGIVKGFDNFTVILTNRSGQHLVYKHAIAQLVSHRPGGQRREGVEESGSGHEGAGAPDEEQSAPQQQTHSTSSHQHGRREDQGGRPPREEQGNRPPRDEQGNRGSRKDGFNRLDLSSVRLSSEDEEKVGSNKQ